jgi:hypothetical protein
MISKDYLIFEDFLTQEEASRAAAAMQLSPQDDDREMYSTFSLFGPEVLEDNAITYDWDAEGKIKLAVKHAHSVFRDNYEIKGEFTLHRCYGNMMREGAWLAGHADWEPDSNGDAADQKPYIAALFLTDDYEGGELHFPDLKISLHPKAGTLVLFTGHDTIHGVDYVTKGIRVNVIIVFHETLNNKGV